MVEVGERLKAQDETILISGLLALKQIIHAFEYHIEELRAPLAHIVEAFFPILEQVMANQAASSSPNQILIMYLISKIFFSANNVKPLSHFTLCSCKSVLTS